jgi:lipopolysaccharide biosynthesis protein
MDPQEFETRYREQIRDILNRLQSVMLVSSQLEAAIADIGDSVQSLSRDVETFLSSQKSNDADGGQQSES